MATANPIYKYKNYQMAIDALQNQFSISRRATIRFTIKLHASRVMTKASWNYISDHGLSIHIVPQLLMVSCDEKSLRPTHNGIAN